MKKILFLSLLFFLSIVTMGQKTIQDTIKMSNYEKYVLAQEKESSQQTVSIPQDTLTYQNQEDVIDTLVNKNPDIQVNYFEYDPFLYSYNIGRFYHNGFNFWMYSDPFFYLNNYWMYDNWNWGYGFMGSYWYPWYYNNFGFGFGLFGWNPWYYGGYGFFGWNSWYHGRWNNHNNWNHNGNHKYDNHPTRPQDRLVYAGRNIPRYQNPRMNARPNFNNSKRYSVNRNNINSNNSSNRRAYSIFYRGNPSNRTNYYAPSRSNYASSNNSSSSRSNSTSSSSNSSYSRSYSNSSSVSRSSSSGGRRR